MPSSTKTKRRPQNSKDYFTPPSKRWKHANVLTSDTGSVTSPVERRQPSQPTQSRCADCGFVGPVEYFRAATNSVLSQRCIQCRALETSLKMYRSEWGPTADFNHQAHVELMVDQLEKWVHKHRPFPDDVDSKAAVAEMAESKVRAWGKRPSGNDVTPSSFQKSFYTSKKRTRSSGTAVRRLDFPAYEVSTPSREPPEKYSDALPEHESRKKSGRAYRATTIPDAEPPEDSSRVRARNREPGVSKRQADQELMARLFPEESILSPSSTASLSASTVTDDPRTESANGDEVLEGISSSQPSIVPEEASPGHLSDSLELGSTLQEDTGADIDPGDPQLFANAAQFLHTIADGLDRLSREPVQQRQYFAKLLGLDTIWI